MRRIARRALGAAAVLLVPAVAVAQGLDPSGLREVDDDDGLAYRGLTVDEIDDLDVVRDGEEIGEIEEVLVDDRGEVVAVAVEFDDLLDSDDVEVVMPIDRLEFGGGDDRAVTTMGDEELRALPVWDD